MSAATAPTLLRLGDPDQMLETDDAFCRYAGGKCRYLRTDKKGGGLHRFCEQHRQRANLNQRRVDLKRRQLRSRRRSPGNHGGDAAIPDPIASWRDQVVLTEEDFTILRVILFGEDFGPDDLTRLLLPWPENPSGSSMTQARWQEIDDSVAE